MAKLTQDQKIMILAFIAALGASINDEEWAQLAGFTQRDAFMKRKAVAKELLRKIMEEAK